MRKEYGRNKKIVLYGNRKEIEEAKKMLDMIEDVEFEMVEGRLKNEYEIRLKIQDAMEKTNFKAHILVDGNTVYPYTKTIKLYDRLKKSGSLEKMTNYFYEFLHTNFDIAHYDKHGFIQFYNGSFEEMKKAILDKATVPGWYGDLQKILDYIQERQFVQEAS